MHSQWWTADEQRELEEFVGSIEQCYCYEPLHLRITPTGIWVSHDQYHTRLPIPHPSSKLFTDWIDYALYDFAEEVHRLDGTFVSVHVDYGTGPDDIVMVVATSDGHGGVILDQLI